jgi:large conductance mechanosensitive channel
MREHSLLPFTTTEISLTNKRAFKARAGMFKEFREFIARGNVIDLAVGIIMGAAFTGVVQSVVNDLVMPLIGYIMAGVDFSNFLLSLDGNSYSSLKEAKDAGAPVITYGQFINTVINFLIVSFVIFIVVKNVNKLKRKVEEEPKGPIPPSQDILLLTEIRDILKNKH